MGFPYPSNVLNPLLRRNSFSYGFMESNFLKVFIYRNICVEDLLHKSGTFSDTFTPRDCEDEVLELPFKWT